MQSKGSSYDNTIQYFALSSLNELGDITINVKCLSVKNCFHVISKAIALMKDGRNRHRRVLSYLSWVCFKLPKVPNSK